MKSLLQLSLMNVVLAIFCLVAFTVGINFGMHKNLQLGPHKHEPFNFAAQHHHPDHRAQGFHARLATRLLHQRVVLTRDISRLSIQPCRKQRGIQSHQT